MSFLVVRSRCAQSQDEDNQNYYPGYFTELAVELAGSWLGICFSIGAQVRWAQFRKCRGFQQEEHTYCQGRMLGSLAVNSYVNCVVICGPIVMSRYRTATDPPCSQLCLVGQYNSGVICCERACLFFLDENFGWFLSARRQSRYRSVRWLWEDNNTGVCQRCMPIGICCY